MRDSLGRIVGGALNPSGRPKVDSELAKAARELSPLALQVWRKTMEDFIAGKGSAADAIRAASDSMARGFGKPPEFVELAAELSTPGRSELLRSASSEELEVMHVIAERAARRARGESVDEPLQLPVPPEAGLALVARGHRIHAILTQSGAFTQHPTKEGTDDEQTDDEQTKE